MKTTEDKNKLIAKFMCFELQEDPNERWFNQWFTTPTEVWGSRLKMLHFDTSWDWLMQVVDRIENENPVSVIISCGNCEIYDCEKAETLIFKEGEKMTTVYNVVVEFIELYNEQNFKKWENHTH